MLAHTACTTSPDIDALPSSMSPSSSLSDKSAGIFEKLYNEGYDVSDVEYNAWLQIMHPGDTRSAACSS